MSLHYSYVFFIQAYITNNLFCYSVNNNIVVFDFVDMFTSLLSTIVNIIILFSGTDSSILISKMAL